MSLLHSRGQARIDCNLTPLIDLAFLLIIFFILVTRMSGDQSPPVALPAPTHPAMKPAGTQSRLTVNVEVDGSQTVVSLGARRFAAGERGHEELAIALARRIRSDPTLPVDIRADRTLPYSAIEPTLRSIAHAAATAGSGKITVRVCALERDEGTNE